MVQYAGRGQRGRTHLAVLLFSRQLGPAAPWRHATPRRSRLRTIRRPIRPAGHELRSRRRRRNAASPGSRSDLGSPTTVTSSDSHALPRLAPRSPLLPDSRILLEGIPWDAPGAAALLPRRPGTPGCVGRRWVPERILGGDKGRGGGAWEPPPGGVLSINAAR